MFVKFMWLSPTLHALQVDLYLTHSTVTQLLSAPTQWTCDALISFILELWLTKQELSPIFRAAMDGPPHVSLPGDPPAVILPLHSFNSHVPRPAPGLSLPEDGPHCQWLICLKSSSNKLIWEILHLRKQKEAEENAPSHFFDFFLYWFYWLQ